ncbi:hypothetical protein AB0P40_19045 [Streptomyces sp. NPDC079189]|uniref:hypothetical protein n=1 Tax=Streptomyces sp. NPDC079189 TaxID=3154514 RepID=UPI0034146C87
MESSLLHPPGRMHTCIASTSEPGTTGRPSRPADLRELAARERVEGLREEADRVLAALAEAETDWQEWLIARQRVSEVLTVLV